MTEVSQPAWLVVAAKVTARMVARSLCSSRVPLVGRTIGEMMAQAPIGPLLRQRLERAIYDDKKQPIGPEEDWLFLKGKMKQYRARRFKKRGKQNKGRGLWGLKKNRTPPKKKGTDRFDGLTSWPGTDLAARMLRRASTSRSQLLQRLAVTVVSNPHLPETLSEQLYVDAIVGTPAELRAYAQAMQGRLRAPLRSALSWSIAVNLAELDRSRSDADDSDVIKASFARLNGTTPVHVFIEPGVGLAPIASNPALARRQLVIYSFQDRQAELQILGLSRRSRIASLRDRFPDISPDAEEMHRYCRSLTDRIISVLRSHVEAKDAQDLDHGVTTLGQSLEDDLAWSVALMECCRWAAREIPDGEPIIYVSRGGSGIPGPVVLMLGDVPRERLFLACSRQGNARRFWADVRTYFAEARTQGLANAGATVSFESAVQEWKRFFSEKNERAKLIGRTHALSVSVEVGGAGPPPALVVYNPSVAAYAETARALMGELVTARNRPVIAVGCAAQDTNWRADPYLQGLVSDKRFAHADTSFTWPLLSSGLTKSCRATMAAWLESEVGEAKYYKGENILSLVQAEVLDFVGRKVFMALALREFTRTLITQQAIPIMVTTPSRYWPVRIMAESARSQGDATVVDLQSLNIIRHAKYLPPVADFVGVIDTTAADIYADYFSFPTPFIRLVGTPYNDRQKRQIESLDRADIAARLGLDPGCRSRILLASQLQPLDRMRPIVEALADLVGANPGLELIIKLHPREGDGRAAAYREIRDAHGIGDRVNLNRDSSPAEVIAATDVCVTIYSNMAREAAIAGKAVVLALFDGWSPPIRFDKEGLAFGATTVDEFKREIMRALDCCASSSSGTGAGSVYFESNPHLMHGRSAALIADLVDEATEYQLAKGFEFESRDKMLTSTVDGGEAMGGIMLVIAENAADIAAAAAQLPPNDPIHVFAPRIPADRAKFGANVRFHSAEPGQMPLAVFEVAVKFADAIAHRLANIVIKSFKHTRVGERLQQLHYPLWLAMRPGIINAAVEDALFRAALETSADRALIIGRTAGFIEHIASQADLKFPNVTTYHALSGVTAHRTGPEAAPSKTPVIAAQAGRLGRLRDLFRRKLSAAGAGPSSEPWRKEISPDVGDLNLQIDVEAINLWAAALEETTFDCPEGPKVLLTTGWHLKTVPPTVEPVLRLLPPELYVVALTSNNSGYEPLRSTLAATPCGHASLCLSPEQVMGIAPEISARAVKDMRRQLRAFIDKDSAISSTPELVKAASQSGVDGALRHTVWQILAWDELCLRMFANGRTVSVACPGRQWHTEVAHIRASQHGCRSITVQNAYMTGGYTYTTPTGDVVTAIDTWSRDVFVQHHNVEINRILVCSTPRFDYLSSMKLLDGAAARVQLGLDPEVPYVLFAAQQGFDDATVEIMRAFASFVHATPVCFGIKLHPRSPDDLVARLGAVVAELSTRNELRITKNDPLDVMLSAADVVSTIFSNVGIEAAALGKPLLITQLLNEELPLPLDQFNIGYVAKSEKDIHEGLAQLLDDGTYRAKLREDQRAFLDSNPAIRDGTSARLIADEILKSVAPGEVDSRQPA